jgi:hypothetical protein
MTLHPGGQTDDSRNVDRVSSGGLAYPSDLTARVLERWHQARGAGENNVPLPGATDLAAILSVCYHATLLREEGRPVTFRLAMSDPGAFDAAVGPPSGFHRLVFARPLPLDQHELRRLSPAVAFSRSLIGTTSVGQGIWGVLTISTVRHARGSARIESERVIGRRTVSAKPSAMRWRWWSPRMVVCGSSAGMTRASHTGSRSRPGHGKDDLKNRIVSGHPCSRLFRRSLAVSS